MQILLVQYLYFWIYGLVWTDIRNIGVKQNLLLTVQMCTDKIYCWLYKCAQMSYLLHRQFLNNQRVLFMLEIVPRFFSLWTQVVFSLGFNQMNLLLMYINPTNCIDTFFVLLQNINKEEDLAGCRYPVIKVFMLLIT